MGEGKKKPRKRFWVSNLIVLPPANLVRHRPCQSAILLCVLLGS